MKRAVIAMSGGVDSSVAAYLTQQRGYECIGVTMRLFDGEDEDASYAQTCCSLNDVQDARSVAYRLGMQHYVWNMKGDFKRQVIDRFIAAYEQGATPNPCVDCNRFIKFAALYERAAALGYDTVVTGHYARICRDADRYYLKKGKDPSKDQSYVLWSLTQSQLAHTLFPLGEQSKDETRAIAEAQGFLNSRKPDSQDICFVPDGDYAAVIRRMTGREYPPGDFLDAHGTVLGQHRGIIHYTVGQRRGIGRSYGSEKLYVQAVDPLRNTVTLSDNASLFSDAFTVGSCVFSAFDTPPGTFRAEVKIRYRHAGAPACVRMTQDGGCVVKFDEPQRAITRGQSAVFYDGDVVLGGGIIQSVGNAE